MATATEKCASGLRGISVGSFLTAQYEELSPGPIKTLSIDRLRLRDMSDPAGWGRQRMSNWCWAACTQIVLNYYGIRVSQEELVLDVYQDLIDRTATKETILYLINQFQTDHSSKIKYVRGVELTKDPEMIIQELEAGRPILVGLEIREDLWHQLILVGVRFRITDSKPELLSVDVIDPWPEVAPEYRLEGKDFTSRLRDAIAVRVE